MINFDLTKIKALVFDVDGVLGSSVVFLSEHSKQPLRTSNIKDGYALQLAIKSKIKLAIITGGKSEAVQKRYQNLGICDFYSGVKDKKVKLLDWIQTNDISLSEVLYMGDDIPDYEVMSLVGCPVAPYDAVPEIKEIAIYISPKKGGEGCVRDVVEQVLKAKGFWFPHISNEISSW